MISVDLRATRPLALLALTVGLASCRGKSGSPDASTTTVVDVPKIEDKEILRRWTALHVCADKIASVGGFRTKVDGAKRRWCRGQDASEACEVTRGDVRDVHAIELYAWDNSGWGGLSLDVHFAPATTGWAVSFHYHQGRNTRLSEDFDMRFARYDAATGPAVDSIHLGRSYSHLIVFVEGVVNNVKVDVCGPSPG